MRNEFFHELPSNKYLGSANVLFIIISLSTTNYRVKQFFLFNNFLNFNIGQ